MQIHEAFPPLGLQIRCGDLQFVGLDDPTAAALAELAGNGVHPRDRMPFTFPWTAVAEDELPANFVQYQWRTRADFRPDAWSLNLAALHRGELIGTQGVTTTDFLLTRTGETGSWLGQAHQGRGLGTAMRQVFCAFLFDHLGFTEITSAAFADNLASLAVSRKTGYRPDGRRRVTRRRAGGTECVELIDLTLTPERLVRPSQSMQVSGVDALRRFIGLDPSPGTGPASDGSAAG